MEICWCANHEVSDHWKRCSVAPECRNHLSQPIADFDNSSIFWRCLTGLINSLSQNPAFSPPISQLRATRRRFCSSQYPLGGPIWTTRIFWDNHLKRKREMILIFLIGHFEENHKDSQMRPTLESERNLDSAVTGRWRRAEMAIQSLRPAEATALFDIVQSRALGASAKPCQTVETLSGVADVKGISVWPNWDQLRNFNSFSSEAAGFYRYAAESISASALLAYESIPDRKWILKLLLILVREEFGL
jgi:hypothetical protein